MSELARIRWCVAHNASVPQGWGFCEAFWRMPSLCDPVVDAVVSEVELTNCCTDPPCGHYRVRGSQGSNE